MVCAMDSLPRREAQAGGSSSLSFPFSVLEDSIDEKTQRWHAFLSCESSFYVTKSVPKQNFSPNSIFASLL